MFKSSVKHYFQTTSLHAVSDVYSTNSTRRTFWVLVLACAFLGLSFEIYTVIHDYMNSPLITTYEVKSADKLKFPTIEICPTNPVNKTKMKEMKVHPAYVDRALQNRAPFGYELVSSAIRQKHPNSDNISYVVYEGAGLIHFQVILGMADTFAKAMAGLQQSYSGLLTAENSDSNNQDQAAVLGIYMISYCFLREGLRTGYPHPRYQKPGPLKPDPTAAEIVSALYCDLLKLQQMLTNETQKKLETLSQRLQVFQQEVTNHGQNLHILQEQNSSVQVIQLQESLNMLTSVFGNITLANLEISTLQEELNGLDEIQLHLTQLFHGCVQLKTAVQQLIDLIRSQATFPDADQPEVQFEKDRNLELIAEIASILVPNEKHHQALISQFNHKIDPMDSQTFIDAVDFDSAKVLVACFFLFSEINCSDVTREVFDQQVGRCFLVEIQQEQTAAGLGFRALIDVNSEDAFDGNPTFSDGVSVRIMESFDPVQIHSLQIPVGTEAAIEMRATKYSLNDNPSYGSCRHDMPRQVQTAPYSDLGCRLECMLRYAVKDCGCRPSFFPKEFITDDYKNLSCRHLHEAMCLGEMVTGFNLDKMPDLASCYSGCKIRCNYWDYDYAVTYKTFPSTALQSTLMEYDPSVKSERWSKNMIVIHASFDALRYTVINQYPAVTVAGFISQIGGHMGLFLGASLISLIQLIELLLSGCWTGTKSCFSSKPPSIYPAVEKDMEIYEIYDANLHGGYYDYYKKPEIVE